MNAQGDTACGPGTGYPCHTASPANYISTSLLSCVAPPLPAGADVSSLIPVAVSLNGQFTQVSPPL
jgi:hypothetical protein